MEQEIIERSEAPEITEFIISLDGGGVRCMLQLCILERLLAYFPQLLERATLFAGTSAGSFLAMGLALGDFPLCRKLINKANLEHIFSRTWGECVSGGWGVWRPKYDPQSLRETLEECLGDATLAHAPKRLLVATFDLGGSDNSHDPTHRNYGVKHWSPKFYDNFADSPHLQKSLVEVGLESSAAPTYFPSHNNCTDGGVTSNNPAAHAISRLLREGAKREQIALLSLGSGNRPLSVTPSSAQYWGMAQWIPLMLDLLMDGSSESATALCEDLLGERFHRCNPVLARAIDLDDATAVEELQEIATKYDLLPTIDYLYKYWFPELPRILPAELEFSCSASAHDLQVEK